MNFLMLLVNAHLALMNLTSSELKVDPLEWQNYKLNYGKSYDTGEDLIRSMIYAQSRQRVDSFNNEHAELRGFRLGLNHMSDWFDDERKVLRGFKVPINHKPINSPEAKKFLEDILDDTSTQIPETLDWRKVSDRVSRVKDQGQCGSCWAFATTGTLEGQEATRRGGNGDGKFSLVELSEQNLIGCYNGDKGHGCEGGLVDVALELIKTMGGIEDEQDYPYTASDLEPCWFDKSKVKFTNSGAAILPEGDEEKLKEVVAKFGPVAAGIDADLKEFYDYESGVFYGETCRNNRHSLNHAVLIVGYGTDPKEGDYWLVKNSWSTSWGEQGYIRMARNRGNRCGIASYATIPTFQNPN